MVELQDISVAFDGRTVFEHVSARFSSGVHAAIMGPSGVGKTTLLRVIAGLLKPDAGRVRVHTPRRAMLFQDPRLLPWLNALENVNTVLSDGPGTLPEAMQWLQRVQLGSAAGKYPAELSGGMQQRVALARALAYGGNLVLLDEPFQGLDDATRDGIITLCREVLREKTTVFVTHDRAEAEALADVIYTLSPEGLRQEEANE